MQISDTRSAFESATSGAEMLVRLQRGRSAISSLVGNISAVNVTRVFPQPNREFVIQYELVDSGNVNNGRRNRMVWGRLFPSEEQARQYALVNEEWVYVADGLPLAIPVFPFDPALPLLSTVSNAEKWTDSLRNRMARFDVSQSTPLLMGVDVLAYRLERRAVLKLTLTDGNERGRSIAVVVKVILPRKAHRFEKRVAELQSAISTSGESHRLRIPLVYGVDSDNGLVFMEYVSGQNLHALVGHEPDFLNACGASGELLSALHNLPQRDLPLVTTETEIQQLYSMSDSIDDVRPEVSESANRGIDNLEKSAIMLSESAPVCLHTDFYDKQVLWSRGRTTLLDFENMAIGDRAKDVGNFLAHLDLRSLQEPDATGIEPGRDAFLMNYGGGIVPAQNIKWWKDATIIRLAMLYSLRPKWRQMADTLIQSVLPAGTGSR